MIRSGLLVTLLLLGSPLLQADDREYEPSSRDASPEAQERMERWQSLPPEKREQLRQRYEKFRQLPPEEQAAVKRRYDKWRELPPEERRAMRDKWQSMSPEDRKAARQRFRDKGEDDRGHDSDDERKDKKGRDD